MAVIAVPSQAQRNRSGVLQFCSRSGQSSAAPCSMAKSSHHQILFSSKFCGIAMDPRQSQVGFRRPESEEVSFWRQSSDSEGSIQIQGGFWKPTLEFTTWNSTQAQGSSIWNWKPSTEEPEAASIWNWKPSKPSSESESEAASFWNQEYERKFNPSCVCDPGDVSAWEARRVSTRGVDKL